MTFQLLKFFSLYAIRGSIIVFNRACPWAVSWVTWIRPFNSIPSFHNITLLFSCHLLYKLQPDYFLSVKNVGLCLQCVIYPRRGSGSLPEVTAGQWDVTCCRSTADISKVSAVTKKHAVWLIRINILVKSAAPIFISMTLKLEAVCFSISVVPAYQKVMLCPRRLQSAYKLPWEHQISHSCVLYMKDT